MDAPRGGSATDNAAELMGPYLLRGWAMLQETCPVKDCYVPLLRSRDGEKLCVLHGVVPLRTAPEPEPQPQPQANGAADQSMEGDAPRQQNTEPPSQALRAGASDAQTRVTPSYSHLLRTLELLVGELGSAATPEDAHLITAAIKHCCDAADALSSRR